jgi:hypothetical protein
LTPAKLKDAIVKAYRDEKRLDRARVTVRLRDAAGAVTAADKARKRNRLIADDDELTVTIADLQGPGLNTTVNAVVDGKGRIELPNLKNPVRAEGLTLAKLKEAIVKAYHDENLLNRAEVTVKFRAAEDPAPPPPDKKKSPQ